MAYNHEDVKMKLFVLSLEEEAIDWFMEHDDNKFKDLRESLKLLMINGEIRGITIPC